MEGTCHFEKCIFAKEFFKEARECFNFKETWWKPYEGEPILVADCAPIRTMIMVQQLSDRLVGVERSQEEMRNETILFKFAANKLRGMLEYEIQPKLGVD